MKADQATKMMTMWVMGLALMFGAGACGKGKSSGTSSSSSGGGTVASAGGGASTGDGQDTAQVSAQAEPNNVAVAGKIALTVSLALDADTPDTVLAFSVADNSPSADLSTVIKAPVAADGRFSITLPQNDPEATAIKACQNPDGTYDRTKLAAIAGPIPASETDAQVTAMVNQELKKDDAGGGQAYVLVTMASHPELSGMEQLVAQAESFKFIQLPTGKDSLLALPTSAAKGDLGLGQITMNGDDATASLMADSSTFSTDPEQLSELARTQKALKFIRNIWMNTNPKTAEAYLATPYFSWASLVTKSLNAWEAPTDSSYVGYGVGFSDQSGKNGIPTIDLSAVCDRVAPNFTLTPPSPLVPVDGEGQPLAQVATLDNANTDAATSDAKDGGNASRMACSSQDTGFYAHSETGLSGWNWSGNGYSGKVADGLWKLDLNGANIANFDLAAATPLDANGNPIVYVPAINVTTAAAGVIDQVQVKLYRYDTTANAYTEVTDLTAFQQLISSSYLSVGLGGGSTSEGAMYSPGHNIGTNKPLTLAGHVFSVAGSALTNGWVFPGTTPSASQIAADSIVVQYQMYGNTYRFDHRLSFGN